MIALTEQQRRMMGRKNQNPPPHLWNQAIAPLYQSVDSRNLELGDGSQTYYQFVAMDRRPPNQLGTGRYKLSSKKSLEYFFISKGTEDIPPLSVKKMEAYVSRYLKIPVRKHPTLSMKLAGSSITDESTGVTHSIGRKKSGFDVLNILDVMIENYLSEDKILVAFIEADLQEEGEEMDARATGDGVAVVGHSKGDFKNRLIFIIETVIHETLHTVGFDHCLAWKCLMNSYTNFEMWLCPACSRKLYHDIGITSAEGVIQWLSPLVEQLKVLHAGEPLKKGKKLLQALKALVE